MLGCRVDAGPSASTSGRSAGYSQCLRNRRSTLKGKVPGLCRSLSSGSSSQGRPSHSSATHPPQYATAVGTVAIQSAVDVLLQHGSDLCLLSDVDASAVQLQSEHAAHATFSGPSQHHVQPLVAHGDATGWAGNGSGTAAHASTLRRRSQPHADLHPAASHLQGAGATAADDTVQQSDHASEQGQQGPGIHIRHSGAYIMGAIKKQRSFQRLAVVLQLHGAHRQLNALHASAALVHAAQLLDSAAMASSSLPGSSQQAGTCSPVNPSVGSYEPQLHEHLMQLVSHRVSEFGARQAANCLWAASKLSAHMPVQFQMPVTLQYQLLDQFQLRMEEAVPQELSNALYGVACLGLVPSEAWLSKYVSACSQAWPLFSRQDLALMLWATGKLASRPVSQCQESSNAHLSLQAWLSGSHESAAWLAALLASQQPWLAQSSPQELASSCWGLAQLAAGDKQRAQIDGSHSSSRHRSGRASQRAQTDMQRVIVTACAGPWGHAMSDSVLRQLHCCGGSEITALASGLLQLQQLPGWRLLALRCLHAAAAVAGAGALQPRAAALLLHAACVQLPGAGGLLAQGPELDAWVLGLLRAILHRAERANAYDVSLALHAVACTKPAIPSWAATQLLALAQSQMDTAPAASLTLIIWSATKAQLPITPHFLATFQRASYASRASFSSREMAAVFWALGRLRARPEPKWLQDTLSVICKSSQAYSIGELAQIASSLAHMGFKASEEWIEWLVSELQHKLCEAPAAVPGCTAVATLCALSALAPTSPVTVKWVEEELVPNVMEPLIPHLGTTELACMVWACACMRRELRAQRPPVDPQAAGSAAATAATAAAASWDVAAEVGGIQWLVPRQPGSQARDQAVDKAQAEAQAAAAVEAQGHEGQRARGKHAKHRTSCDGDGDLRQETETTDDGRGDEPQVDGQQEAGDDQKRLWQGVRLSPAGQVAVLRAVDRLAGRLNSKQVSMILYALPRLRLRPSTCFLSRQLFSQPAGCSAMSDVDLCIAMYALGSTGQKPPDGWMSAWAAELSSRAHRLNAGMLTGVLCGLSALNTSPGEAWMSSVVVGGLQGVRQMHRQQLTRAYMAVADLEPRLAEQWGHEFCALLYCRVSSASSMSSTGSTDAADAEGLQGHNGGTMAAAQMHGLSLGPGCSQQPAGAASGQSVFMSSQELDRVTELRPAPRRTGVAG